MADYKDTLRAALGVYGDTSGDLDLRASVGTPGYQIEIRNEIVETGQALTQPGVIDGLLHAVATTSLFGAAWNNWTPTYNCSGDMSIGSVSLASAKHRGVGSVGLVRITFGATLGDLPDTGVQVTLPAGESPLDNQVYLPCYISDGDGTRDVGWCRPSPGSPGSLWFYKKDFGYFATGSSFYVSFCGLYERTF